MPTPKRPFAPQSAPAAASFALARALHERTMAALRPSRWLLLALLGLGVLVAGPVRAQKGEGPYVLLVPMHEVAPERLEELYASVEVAGARAVGPDERAGVDRPLSPSRFRPTRPDDVKASLLEARAALRRLELAAVDAALRAAEEALLTLATPDAHRDLFAELLLFRAEIALAQGRAAEALADLSLLARLDPERETLHPGLYPPRVVEAFARARAEAEAAPAGLLVIAPRALPEGAGEVLVDGRPVALEEAAAGIRVAAGRHLVTVRASERVTRSIVVEVEAGKPLRLAPFLPPPGADEQRAQLLPRLVGEAPPEEALAALCALSAADAVVLLEEGRARIFVPGRGLSVLDAASGDAPLAFGRAVKDALKAPAPRPLSPSTGALVVEPSPAPPAAEAEGDPLAWGIIAGTVAAGALLAMATGATLAWHLWPAEKVGRPARPVVISCCTTGRR